MYERLNALGIGFMTVVIFAFTQRSDVQVILPRLFLFYLIFSLAGYGYYLYARKIRLVTRTTTLFGYLISATTFFLIAATGWFYSPFVYFAYILGIVYAFLFGSLVTAAYSFVLMGLYLYEVSQFGLVWSDYITLITIMMLVPGAHYLRAFYLLIAQQQKKILILDEKKAVGADSADELLSNKITRFAVDMRQDASDIRQIALLQSTKEARGEDVSGRIKEIGELAESILWKIENFEVETTGRKIRHTS